MFGLVTRDQKIVATGALSGVLLMLVALALLPPLLPDLAADAPAGDRLAYAAKWIALAILPLFTAIVTVGNARFTSEAIDPMRDAESPAMRIDARVVDNSVQQFLLFAAAALALAAVSSGDQLSIIAAAALVHVVARFAFWFGYRRNPLLRAPGMSATSYCSVVLFALAIWRAWLP